MRADAARVGVGGFASSATRDPRRYTPIGATGELPSEAAEPDPGGACVRGAKEQPEQKVHAPSVTQPPCHKGPACYQRGGRPLFVRFERIRAASHCISPESQSGDPAPRRSGGADGSAPEKILRKRNSDFRGPFLLQGRRSDSVSQLARKPEGPRLERFLRLRPPGGCIHESSGVAASHVLAGAREHDPFLRLHRRVRQDLRRELVMIYLTAAVSLFLFVYLFAALIRPEWF